MLRRRFVEANFAYLLVGLLFFLFLIPSLRIALDSGHDQDAIRHFVSGGFCLMLLIGVWSLRAQERTFRIGLVLVGLQFVVWALDGASSMRWVEMFARLTAITFYLMSVAIAARAVFNFRRVDTNLMVGAVCVYLMIGLLFAILYYYLADHWGQASFRGVDFSHNLPAFDDFLYFSFTTMTTAGYGDITPIHPILRTLAYLEMIIGQFYVAILVAGLVSMFTMSRGNTR